MKRDEGGELRPPRWELEESSYDDVATMLAEGTITRGQAIKLGGAALLAGTGMLLFQSPADARRRHKRHRRKKKVTSTTDQVDFGPQTPNVPSAPQFVQITNPTDKPVELKLVGDDSGNFSIEAFPGFNPADVNAQPTVAPHTSASVPVTFTPAASGATYSGTLVATDANGNEVSVPLTGTGA